MLLYMVDYRQTAVSDVVNAAYPTIAPPVFDFTSGYSTCSNIQQQYWPRLTYYLLAVVSILPDVTCVHLGALQYAPNFEPAIQWPFGSQ